LPLRFEDLKGICYHPTPICGRWLLVDGTSSQDGNRPHFSIFEPQFAGLSGLKLQMAALIH
jgi:hypothetical protein